MKRVLIAAGVIVSIAIGVPAITVEPLAVLATTSAASSCASSDGRMLAQGGCCQGRGGVCGCSNRTLKCCNGTTATGTDCSCRASDPIEARTFETL
jgi:hypothetical protein